MDIGTVEGTIRLRDEFADVFRRFDRSLKDLDRQIDDIGGGKGKSGGLGRLIDQSEDLTRGMTRVGTAIGVGVLLPMAAVGKVTSDFENAFANAVKTVDGLDVDAFGVLNREAKELREEVIGLSKTIPVSAAELANLAAVGGQFGVGRSELIKFTDTVAKLGVAVDGISAENAAAGLAQIRAILGPANADFERLASTLVDLGNKGSSTEATILETARRFASAGSAAGASAADIFGMSAAVSNLGFEAEVGGTVLSKTFLEITRAVETGGAELDKFAKVAGVSSAEFASAWGSNATNTFEMLIGKLGELNAAGGNMAVTMEDLFGKDIRQTQIVQSLALAQGNLSKAINDGRTAYQQNTALAEEARKKYATFENQLKLFRNEIQAVAIDLGGPLLQALRDALSASRPLLDMVGTLAGEFTALPEPMRKVIVMAGLGVGLAGVLLVLTAKGVEAIRMLRDMRGALIGLGAAQGAAGGIGVLSGALGSLKSTIAGLVALLPAGAGLAGLLGLTGGLGFAAAAKGVDDYRVKLEGMSAQQAILQAASQAAGRSITNYADAWGIAKAAISNAAESQKDLTAEQVRLKQALDAANPFLSTAAAEAAVLAGQSAIASRGLGSVAAVGNAMVGSLKAVGDGYRQIVVSTAAATSSTASYTDILARTKAEAAALTPAVRAQLSAFLELGGNVEEAAKQFKISEGAVRAFQSTTKASTKDAREFSEAMKKAADEASRLQEDARLGTIGFGDIEQAALMANAISKFPPGFKATKEAAAEMKAVVDKGIKAIVALSLPIPKYMKDASASMVDLSRKAGTLEDDFDMAAVAYQKIGKDDFSPTVQSIDQAARNTLQWANYLDMVVGQVAQLSAPGTLEFFKNAASAKPPTGWTKVGASIGDVFSDIPSIMQRAFEGGGGLEGAMKSIGTALADAITRPLLAAAKEMGARVSGAISAGVAASGALGGAVGGNTGALIASTASAIGGAALTTTALGVAAKTSMVAMVGLSAATLGIGAAAVGVYLLYKRFFTVSKEVKEARKQVQSFQEELWKTATAQQQVEAQGQGWAATLIVTRDAYQRMGKTAAEAERDVAALLNTKKPDEARAAMQKINEVVGTFRAHLKAANDQFTPLLEKGTELGQRLPESLLLAIQELRVMGDLTEENIALFDRLAGAQAIDYKKFEEAAGRYKINPDALGLGYQQSRTDATAKQMIDDVDILLKGGATMGTILHGMKEEISQVVAESIKFGTVIPENMRPWIEELARTGQLIDENGNAITDLSTLKFGDELKTSFDEITEALLELIATLKGPFVDAIKNAPKSADFDFNFRENWERRDMPANEPTAMAKGGILNRPTFVAGEAGAEIVSPLDDYHNAMLRSFALGGGGNGRPANITFVIGGQAVARATLPYLADEMEIQGI